MSVVHSYRPFPKPESQTTVEEMQAKLAKRVEAVTARRAHAGKPLEWEKPVAGATGLKTKCGRYSCAKITLNGKVSYELWKLAPGAGWFRQLNKGLDNFLQVQKLAQMDADKAP
jgi:hypothetical protein